jgi:hypothetical protein
VGGGGEFRKADINVEPLLCYKQPYGVFSMTVSVDFLIGRFAL